MGYEKKPRGPQRGAQGAGGSSGHVQREFVRVWFACCGVYARAYARGCGAFMSRCPRCLRQLVLNADPASERAER